MMTALVVLENLIVQSCLLADILCDMDDVALVTAWLQDPSSGSSRIAVQASLVRLVAQHPPGHSIWESVFGSIADTTLLDLVRFLVG
jgi:hypothetical protein